jgi:hypothetical protein
MTTLYEHWPDSAFPLFFGLPHAPLLSKPEVGSAIIQHCTACQRRVKFSGRDLCRLFPKWLTRDIWIWASMLKCDECPSPRQLFSAIRDSEADGFSHGYGDPDDAQRIRRLMEWLPLGGLKIDDVAYLVRADAIALREAGFDEDIVALFSSSHRSDHFHPTPQSLIGVSVSARED